MSTPRGYHVRRQRFYVGPSIVIDDGPRKCLCAATTQYCRESACVCECHKRAALTVPNVIGDEK